MHAAGHTDPFYQPVHTYVMNPKAITMGELYGQVNHLTLEWKDGLMGLTIRGCVQVRAPTRGCVQVRAPTRGCVQVRAPTRGCVQVRAPTRGCVQVRAATRGCVQVRTPPGDVYR